jgi:aminocarboxymuconate-semialdehyde decarboxylase
MHLAYVSTRPRAALRRPDALADYPGMCLLLSTAGPAHGPRGLWWLKTCFAQAGGYGVLGIGRMDHGHEARPESSVIAKFPSDDLKACWFGTITRNERALRYLVDTVGAGRVVPGRDCPADKGEPGPIDRIESCDGLSAAEETAVLGSIAVSRFGLERFVEAEGAAPFSAVA